MALHAVLGAPAEIEWRTVALSSAGALLGSLIGGGLPLISQRMTLRAEHLRRYEDTRRDSYADYLTLLLSLPARMREAFPDQSRAVVDDLVRALYPLEARLLLDAPPAIRPLIQRIREAIGTWGGTADERGGQNLELPLEHRRSILDIYGEVYRETIYPAIVELADALSADLRGSER
jgi:hypothetical protein